MILLYVALGSALGGVGRYLLSGLIQARAGTLMPVGTFVVNVTGAFALGFIARYALLTTSVTPGTRAFLTIGLCGGYTTFSTFSFETVQLFERGEYGRAGWYVAASVVFSLFALIAGAAAARALAEWRA